MLWSDFWSPAPSTSGRPPKPVGNVPSPFSQRTAASFKTHFPRGWPYLVSSGTRKEMESSNWVCLLKQGWIELPTSFPRNEECTRIDAIQDTISITDYLQVLNYLKIQNAQKALSGQTFLHISCKMTALVLRLSPTALRPSLSCVQR